jgi:hypothetical protein
MANDEVLGSVTDSAGTRPIKRSAPAGALLAPDGPQPALQPAPQPARQSEPAKPEAAPPGTRESILQQGVSKIDAAVATGVLRPLQGWRMKREFLENSDSVLARRMIAADPETAATALSGAGGKGTVFPYLGEGRRQTLLEQAQRETASRYRRQERDEAKAEQAAVTAAKKAAGLFKQDALANFDPLSPKYQKMDNAAFEAGLDAHAEHMTLDEGRALRALREKPHREGGISNPDLYHALRLRLLTQDPTVSRASIVRFARPGGGLSAKDAGDLIKLVEETEQAKDVSQRPMYREGVKHITILMTGVTADIASGMGIPILTLPMKEAQARKYSDVLIEFRRRAIKMEQAGESLADLPTIGKKMAEAALAAGTESKPQPGTGAGTGPSQPGAAPKPPKPQPEKNYQKTVN